MASDPETVVQLNPAAAPSVGDEDLTLPSSPIAPRRNDRIDSGGRQLLAKQSSIFNRRPNQFISLDYEELVALMYSNLVSKQPAPWKHDWKRLFCRQMPLYTNVRVTEDFRPLREQYDILDPTPEKLAFARRKYSLESRPQSPSGPDAGDQAFEWLDNVDSEELHDSDIKAAMDGEDMPPGTLTPTGANGERPVVEGVPIQDDDEKMEIANAFRRGNLDGLLATCGFQRIEKEMIEESGREVGKNGIAVHLPDREDVAVRGYYRNVFKCEVKKREAADCFKATEDEETVFRALMFVYAYKLFVEAKEFVVAYTLLAMAEQPMTLEQLRDSANALLEKAGLDEIDFDTEDAIVEVSKLGLLNREGDMLMGVSDLQPLQQAVSLAEFQDKVVVNTGAHTL